MRLLACCALSLVLSSGVGCKKKEEPKPDDKVAAGKVEEKPKAPAAEEEKEKPAETPVAKPEDKPVETIGEDKPAEPEAPKGPTSGMWGLQVPADSIGVAGIASIDELFGMISSKASTYGLPMKINKDFVIQAIKGPLRLGSMDWLSTDKPVKIVAWNPKKSKNMGLLIVPITSKDALVGALPADKKADQDGNEFGFEVRGMTVYLNVLDGHAVISSEKSFFAEAKTFLSDVIANFKPTGMLDIRVAAANLRGIFADELTGVRQTLEQLKPRLAEELSKGSPFGGAGKMLDWYFDMLNTFVEEAEGFSIAVETDDKGNLNIPLTVQAKAGGKIAAFATQLSESELGFVKGAPAESWLVFGSHIDPKAFTGMMSTATDMMAEVLKLTPDEKEKIGKLMVSTVELQDGKSWFSAYADGTFPVAFAGTAGVTDGAKYREIFDQYMQLLIGKALTMAKEVMPPELQTIPIDDIPKLVEAVNAITSKVGLKIETANVTDGGVTVQSLSLTADLATVMQMAGPDKAEKVKQVTDITGNKLELAIAYGATRMSMALGPNAIATSKRLAGDAPTENAVPTAISERIGKGNGFLMYVDIGKALAAFKPIIAAMGQSDKIPEIPAGSVIGFSMGGEGNTVKMSFSASLDNLVKAGIEAATKARPAPEPPPAVERAPEAPAPAP